MSFALSNEIKFLITAFIPLLLELSPFFYSKKCKQTHSKQTYLISWKRLHEKFLSVFKKTKEKYDRFWKKKMITSIKEELKPHQDTKEGYICGKRNCEKLSKSINNRKVRDHCHYTGKYRDANHSIYNLKFNMPNEIPVVFHNGSNHDYHFIIKELANDF